MNEFPVVSSLFAQKLERIIIIYLQLFAVAFRGKMFEFFLMKFRQRRKTEFAEPVWISPTISPLNHASDKYWH